MEHELKTDPVPFDDVAAGLKTFEIRKEDRNFVAGDTLVLRRTEHTGKQMAAGAPLIYTPGAPPLRVQVLHLLRGPVYGLHNGWVIMSISTTKESINEN